MHGHQNVKYQNGQRMSFSHKTLYVVVRTLVAYSQPLSPKITAHLCEMRNTIFFHFVPRFRKQSLPFGFKG